MRIDKLEIRNFKKFNELTLTLHPQLTVLVGRNAAGKTTVLDALAVSMGVWLVDPPDTMLQNSRRNILEKEIHLHAVQRGDRTQFQQSRPVVISATGQIGAWTGTWTRKISEGGVRTSNAEAQEALNVIQGIYEKAQRGDAVLCPILAYYGAGRGWLPSRERASGAPPGDGPARRWAAFYDCFSERIRFAELRKWFLRETTEAGNRGGRMRPGFQAVRQAILRCVPDSDGVWFSSDLDQIVLSIGGQAQPIDNLSAGLRMMLAMVADLAIKAVTQNAHLLPEDQLGPEDQPLPRVLRDTRGVALIDELDVHLHPSWQRRVAADLKATFPAIQFVCTTHSPQVIGELSREEVRLLGEDEISHPQVARGADSNWILDHVIRDGAASENAEARALQQEIEDAMEEGDFPKASDRLEQLKRLMEGGLTSELVSLESRLASLEALARDDGTDSGRPDINPGSGDLLEVLARDDGTDVPAEDP